MSSAAESRDGQRGKRAGMGGTQRHRQPQPWGDQQKNTEREDVESYKMEKRQMAKARMEKKYE